MYPGDARLVGACLSLRASHCQSVSMVEKLHAAISYEHKIRFMNSPTEHPSLKLLMRAIRREYSQPRNPVLPLELAHLQQMNLHLETTDEKNNLVLWRTVWRMNISFYTLCRFSELNCLTTDDLSFLETPSPHVRIRIKKSKTDQEGVGDTKYLYPVSSDVLLCPVRLTKSYLARLAYPAKDKPYVGHLQPRVQQCSKLNAQIPISHQTVCYTNSLEDGKKLLSELGIQGRFGEHSGRRGGATAAACNGASIENIQSLGNWKSSNSAIKYVAQDLTQKEKISRLLYPK